MKSYTDLEQSKKLAEILSLESADMYWKNGVSDKYIQCLTPFVGTSTDIDYDYDVPCWSLAALISIIPQELFGGEYIINITEGLDYKWIISYEPPYEISSYINVSGDSLIDCCVEIIIKLKERNLL